MKVVPKVVAYITRHDHLLVFHTPDAPEAGIQVPAGTLEPGEDPAAGALREAMEETGLDCLRLGIALGETDFDIRPYGREEIHHRYFFHIECTADTPATWQHTDPAPSVPGPVHPFSFWWARLPDDVPNLIGEFGACLPALYHHLNFEEPA